MTTKAKMARGLTPRQRQLLEFMRAFQREHGRPALIREMGTALGLASKNSVHELLTRLHTKGLVRHQWHRDWTPVEQVAERCAA